MISKMLGLFGFFNKATNIILFSIIGLAIIVGIILMLKFPASRKVMLYIFSVIIIIIGGLSGVGLYKDITAKSYVVGSLDYDYLTTQESFIYAKSSIIFYEQENVNNGYYYEDNIERIDDFNGKTHNYLVKLNDYIIKDVTINAGSVYFVVFIDFHDTEDNVVNSSRLDISIKFLNDKTNIKMLTTLKDVSYLEDYFSNYGFVLKLVEQK